MSYGFGKTWVIGEEELDLWIEFSVSRYYPGRSGTYYDPPEPSEYELELDSVTLDPPGEALPSIVVEEVVDWFHSSPEAYDRAVEAVEDDYR